MNGHPYIERLAAQGWQFNGPLSMPQLRTLLRRGYALRLATAPQFYPFRHLRLYHEEGKPNSLITIAWDHTIHHAQATPQSFVCAGQVAGLPKLLDPKWFRVCLEPETKTFTHPGEVAGAARKEEGLKVRQPKAAPSPGVNTLNLWQH